MREDFVTVSEAKVGIHKLIAGLAERTAVLLLRHGKPVAALLHYPRYLALLDRIEELEDRLALVDAAADADGGLTNDWEKVKAEAGLLAGDEPERSST